MTTLQNWESDLLGLLVHASNAAGPADRVLVPEEDGSAAPVVGRCARCANALVLTTSRASWSAGKRWARIGPAEIVTPDDGVAYLCHGGGPHIPVAELTRPIGPWTNDGPAYTPDLARRPTPVLVLDVDGTIRQGKDDQLGRFVNGPDDVVVFPEAVVRMRAWCEAGGRIVAVSNQGGIALGIVTAAAVEAAMDETDRQTGFLLDGIHYCTHHPDAAEPLARRCWCRKPAPGLIITAIETLGDNHQDEWYPHDLVWMVGDRPEDEQAAAAAGIPFQWAADWRAGHTIPGAPA